MVNIAPLSSHPEHLAINRHGHLDGVDPCPVTDFPAVHLKFKVLLDMFDHAVVLGHHITVDVGLLAALVICVRCLDAIAGCPFVMIGPSVGIVDVLRVVIYLIESHQSLVIDSSCPEVARTDTSHIGVEGGVGMHGHEICIDLPCRSQYILTLVLRRGDHA